MNDQSLSAGDLLIFFDESKYKSAVALIDMCKDFEKCILLFNAIGVGEFEQDDFFDLILSPESLVNEKRMEALGNEPLTLAGQTISKARLLEISEKPAGYYPYLREVERINKLIGMKTRRPEHEVYSLNVKTPQAFLRLFTFDENGKVTLKKSIMDEITKHYSIYITSDKAKKAFLLSQAFVNFMYESNASDVIKMEKFGEFINSAVSFESKSNELVINYDYIRTFDSRK